MAALSGSVIGGLSVTLQATRMPYPLRACGIPGHAPFASVRIEGGWLRGVRLRSVWFSLRDASPARQANRMMLALK